MNPYNNPQQDNPDAAGAGAAPQQQQQQQQQDMYGMEEARLPLLRSIQHNVTHDPLFMSLTPVERQWALAIKTAAANDEELRPISDYEYAHHALVSQDNVAEALSHIRGLQYFREEYKIQDTPQEGMELFGQFVQKHPGFILSVECDLNSGHFVVVYDYKCRNTQAIDMPNDWRIHLGGMYYLAQALNSHLLAIREGVVHICECEGMGWKNSNHDHHRRGWDHLWSHYPLRHKEISWLRTPLVGNLLYAFLKPFMSDQMKSKFQLGCCFYGYEGRIDGIFKIPTPEIAQANLLLRMHSYLTLRYYHQDIFQLPNADDNDDDNDDNDDDINDDDIDDGADGADGVDGDIDDIDDSNDDEEMEE